MSIGILEFITTERLKKAGEYTYSAIRLHTYAPSLPSLIM